jgi:hypothetical protein
MSTSRLRPMLQAVPPVAESAVRRSLAARAPKKNPSRRKIFPAASPCWADANRARAEWTDPYCADLWPTDSSPALRARRSAVPVCLRSLMRPPRPPAATVRESSLSSKVKRVARPVETPTGGPVLVRLGGAWVRAQCHTFRKNGNWAHCPLYNSGRSRQFSQYPLPHFTLASVTTRLCSIKMQTPGFR